MAKRKVNVALIGTNFMGKAHSNAYRQVDKYFDLPVKPVMKVICGLAEDDPAAAAEQLGWEESSTNWKEVVRRDDIDVVDVSVPGNLHHPLVMAAAKAGKHIVCEKPLANNQHDAQEMLAAVKKAGVKHLCGFAYRAAPAVATIKAMIDRGELGDIFHYRSAYLQDWIVDPEFPINWRLQKKVAGSGSLGDIGAHIVDMCHYLVGEIDELSASMRTFVKKRPVAEGQATIAATKGRAKSTRTAAVDVDDGVTIQANIKGADTMATFEATRFAPGRRNYNSIEIYGSKGSVLWNKEDMNVFHYYNCADPEHVQGFRKVLATDPAHPNAEAWWPAGHIIGYEHLFIHEIRDFLANLNRKKVTYPTFADGVACQKVLDTVVRAAKSRKWEKVK